MNLSPSLILLMLGLLIENPMSLVPALCQMESVVLTARVHDQDQDQEGEADAAEDHDGSTATLAQRREVVLACYRQVHAGWSSDEVVLQPELNERFLDCCRARLPGVGDVDFNWTLLNMRKAGLLKVTVTQRNTTSVSHIIPLAEIAARHVFDKHKQSTDRIMCDPALRAEFDNVVQEIDREADVYAARKAAFQLRKQRQLKPELLARIADWGREIETLNVQDVRNDLDRIPKLPGIYIFRDATGYLYIGQADNLNTRLKNHFADSHNFSLASYLKYQANENVVIELHSFPADSRAKETMIRRAYESELIASRKPRFNIQP